jgi:hypothetical protein
MRREGSHTAGASALRGQFGPTYSLAPYVDAANFNN